MCVFLGVFSVCFCFYRYLIDDVCICKKTGMRRPSWNKSQAIQQVIMLKALLEPVPECGDVSRKLSNAHRKHQTLTTTVRFCRFCTCLPNFVENVDNW